jgi:hypothetical protein
MMKMKIDRQEVRHNQQPDGNHGGDQKGKI